MSDPTGVTHSYLAPYGSHSDGTGVMRTGFLGKRSLIRVAILAGAVAGAAFLSACGSSGASSGSGGGGNTPTTNAPSSGNGSGGASF